MSKDNRKYKTPLKTCENCKCLNLNWNFEEGKQKKYCVVFGDVFYTNCKNKVEKRG